MNYKTINVTEPTKSQFEQVRDDLASETGGRPTHDQAVRALIERYYGDGEIVYVADLSKSANAYHQQKDCSGVQGASVEVIKKSELPDRITACTRCAGGFTAHDIAKVSDTDD